MDADGTTGGTYTLLLTLPQAVDIAVGALGTHRFPGGAYAYTGSALGSGGFARVDRHRRVARGDHDVRHWHVDYLTGHSATELVDVVTSPGVDAECAIARRLPGGPVEGFGASDCGCRSHLAVGEDIETLRATVASVHQN
ncbi:GIY-YIG nuclease family protein [Haloplanus aerogenes]|uniref:Endonuclease-3 n=1 Tax=Haloplanus aerogenes TaxID=660522 RepID=A0A3M0CTQ5_9EURY|nr:GIY-YIG nuclease family protein [Haloplanus aerogenes]AZH26591.1 GIY-YIG nuclease family protein [Haloplanus aerogenes]RMB12822.1 endonuclease-3 [Haloplanus aerogenes]